MLQPELTLVLAATRDMGIGLNGTLPWTGLRKEMAYFARVTKRVSNQPTTSQRAAINAVIMGRKTWDSIPPKFRPLKGRLNIVISRSATLPTTTTTPESGEAAEEGPIMAPSLEQALSYLRSRQQSASSSSPCTESSTTPSPPAVVDRVFVIGGGQIYAAALALKETRRILLTSVSSPDFECDTFFPLKLAGGNGEAAGGQWKKRSTGELTEWTGEDEAVVGGVQEEAGTRYEFQMWEKVE